MCVEIQTPERRGEVPHAFTTIGEASGEREVPGSDAATGVCEGTGVGEGVECAAGVGETEAGGAEHQSNGNRCTETAGCFQDAQGKRIVTNTSAHTLGRALGVLCLCASNGHPRTSVANSRHITSVQETVKTVNTRRFVKRVRHKSEESDGRHGNGHSAKEQRSKRGKRVTSATTFQVTEEVDEDRYIITEMEDD